MSDVDKIKVKEMAELLRKGATMLSQTCPQCKVPLFKLRDGTIICPVCKRKVVFMKENGTIDESITLVIEKLRGTLLTKLVKIVDELEQTDELDKILKLLEAAENIFKLMKRIKENRKGTGEKVEGDSMI